jgi:hypothetical protein
VSAAVRQDKPNAWHPVFLNSSFPPSAFLPLAKFLRRVYRPINMNLEKLRRFGIPKMSSEAFVGIGITVAELGGLCLLLGWAEQMRSVPKIALVWFALGVVLVVVGGLTAAIPRFNERRRIRAERLPQSDVPPAEAKDVSEPEEQLY